MIKFFIALIGMAVAALVGTFVFAAFTIQAGHLVALKPASTTVETPELFTRYVQGESGMAKKQTSRGRKQDRARVADGQITRSGMRLRSPANPKLPSKKR
jgi:hypothetical protein